jgi:hypothetical protein
MPVSTMRLPLILDPSVPSLPLNVVRLVFRRRPEGKPDRCADRILPEPRLSPRFRRRKKMKLGAQTRAGPTV